MAEKSNPYGVSKKDVSGFSKATIDRLEKMLFQVTTEQEKRHKKDQEQSNMAFLKIMTALSKQTESTGKVFDKRNPDGIAHLMDGYLKEMSSGVSSVKDSIVELTEKLESLEKDKRVLNDKQVMAETHQAQRMMTRNQQGERDKAAPGMLLRGLVASQKAPKYLQWLSNKLGLRSFDTRKAELSEKEDLETNIAQTKIDRARAIKKRDFQGIKGKGETTGELLGQKTPKEWELEKATSSFMEMADAISQAMQKIFPETLIAEPMLQIPREDALKKKFKKGVKSMKGAPLVGESTLPFDMPGEEGSGLSTKPPDTPSPYSGKGLDSFFGKKETPIQVTLSKQTEISFSKLIGKAIRENMKDALLDAAKELDSGEIGSGEEMGVIGPEAKISKGQVNKLAKKTGRALGDLLRPILGERTSDDAGDHQHGGDIARTAGTGAHSFNMNKNEGINVPYDNMAISVPSNLGLNIVKEADMKKLASLNNGASKTGGDNTGMEFLLKQLLEANKKANDILSQIAEKEMPMPGNNIASSRQSNKTNSGRSTGFGLSPMGVL